jgi:ParB-like chromosome segregation protein Spo0J
MTTKITDLVPDKQNARKHTPRNIKTIKDGIEGFGMGRSILIDEEDGIVAGNATVEAAKAAGITKIRVVETDGTELVAVRRSNLTPEQKRLMALYDNRTAELASWDAAQIAASLEAGLDLSGLFDGKEQAEILSKAGDELVPDFQPVSEDEQGRLDQKKPVVCPKCGHEFTP